MDKMIEASKEFLDKIWEDEKAMQDTINPNHPAFIAGISDEVGAYSMHEKNKMMVEIIKRQLNEIPDLYKRIAYLEDKLEFR